MKNIAKYTIAGLVITGAVLTYKYGYKIKESYREWRNSRPAASAPAGNPTVTLEPRKHFEVEQLLERDGDKYSGGYIKLKNLDCEVVKVNDPRAKAENDKLRQKLENEEIARKTAEEAEKAAERAREAAKKAKERAEWKNYLAEQNLEKKEQVYSAKFRKMQNELAEANRIKANTRNIQGELDKPWEIPYDTELDVGKYTEDDFYALFELDEDDNGFAHANGSFNAEIPDESYGITSKGWERLQKELGIESDNGEAFYKGWKLEYDGKQLHTTRNYQIVLTRLNREQETQQRKSFESFNTLVLSDKGVRSAGPDYIRRNGRAPITAEMTDTGLVVKVGDFDPENIAFLYSQEYDITDDRVPVTKKIACKGLRPSKKPEPDKEPVVKIQPSPPEPPKPRETRIYKGQVWEHVRTNQFDQKIYQKSGSPAKTHIGNR